MESLKALRNKLDLGRIRYVFTSHNGFTDDLRGKGGVILFFNKKQTLFIEKAPFNTSPICAKAQMTSHTVSDALTRYEKQTLSAFHGKLV